MSITSVMANIINDDCIFSVSRSISPALASVGLSFCRHQGAIALLAPLEMTEFHRILTISPQGRFARHRIACQMKGKVYLVHLKDQLGVRSVFAARVEITGEHLVFLNPHGELAALFLLDLVESWNEISPE
jgi:hypothetical protein